MYKKLLVCLLISDFLLLDQVKSSNAVPWGRRDFAEWNLLKREPGGAGTEKHNPLSIVGREMIQGKRETTGGNEEYKDSQRYGREAFVGDKRESGGSGNEIFLKGQEVGKEMIQREI
ncbi:hypothetical protein ABFA07_007145 [Porites harrisoni]